MSFLFSRNTLLSTFVLCGFCACSSSTENKDSGSGDVLQQDANARVDEPFGRSCDNIGAECPDMDLDGKALTCIGIKGGAENMGFCSRECQPPPDNPGVECYGVPNGQWAQCALQSSGGEDANGQPLPPVFYCAYLCQTTEAQWDCPGTLRCGTPNEEGTAFCVP